MLLFKTFEARFAPMSEDIKAVAVAILDGHVKISGRLDVLTDTVKRAQSETKYARQRIRRQDLSMPFQRWLFALAPTT
jgi:hypothetical protein